jgi:hypothetical protein
MAPRLKLILTGRVSLVYKKELVEGPELYIGLEDRNRILTGWYKKYNLTGRPDIKDFFLIIRPV